MSLRQSEEWLDTQETRVDHLPLQLTARPERDEKLGVYSIILLWLGALLWFGKNFLVF